MRITQIDVYQVTCQYSDTYRMSRGQAISALVSTIVRISTDEGLQGFGEVCPLGSAYMEAFARAVPSGIEELGPVLLGQDPRQLRVINHLMDGAMRGHGYIKSPVDIACWDILGKATGLPLCTLLGGRYVDSYAVYRSISRQAPEKMAKDVDQFKSEGYKRFQLKLGGDADEDILSIKAVLGVVRTGDVVVADGNTGWSMNHALRIVNALAGEDVYIEQPCRSLEECLVIREHTRLPIVLCELITGVDPLLKAYERRAMDAVNIKISRVGGLTKAKQVRDLCESLGIVMTLEDSAGGDVTRATVSHLVASTPPELFFNSPDYRRFDTRIADDALTAKEGKLSVPTGPGLGLHVNERSLGPPVLTIK